MNQDRRRMSSAHDVVRYRVSAVIEEAAAGVGPSSQAVETVATRISLSDSVGEIHNIGIYDDTGIRLPGVVSLYPTGAVIRGVVID